MAGKLEMSDEAKNDCTLRDSAAAGRRRQRRGLRGQRYTIAAARGAEDVAHGIADRRADAHHGAARGASRVGHRAPQCVRHLRGGRDRRRSLHRHAVCAGPAAGQADRARAGERAADSFSRNPDCRRAAGRACAGHLSSRPQAAERDADRWRSGEDSRLRAGAATPSRRRALRSVASGTGQGCLHGRHLHRARRHHPLHGAGTVCHRALQRAVRRVGAGCDSLRAGQRQASVCAPRC